MLNQAGVKDEADVYPHESFMDANSPVKNQRLYNNNEAG